MRLQPAGVSPESLYACFAWTQASTVQHWRWIFKGNRILPAALLGALAFSASWHASNFSPASEHASRTQSLACVLEHMHQAL